MQGTFNLGVQNSFTEQVYNELKQLNDRSSATLVLNRDLGAYLFMDINNTFKYAFLEYNSKGLALKELDYTEAKEIAKRYYFPSEVDKMIEKKQNKFKKQGYKNGFY